MSDPQFCLNPNHRPDPVPAQTRGLCSSCYQSARELVRQQRVTWAELEADGKSKPTKTGVGTGSTQAWFLEKDDN